MNPVFAVNYLVWLVISALFFAAGEFLSKQFSINPKWLMVPVIVLAYAMCTLAWLPAILQKKSLSIAGTIWSVLSLAVTVGIGVLIFGERIGYKGLAGMLMAVGAIVLLSLE